jgi:hypothetical protein
MTKKQIKKPIPTELVQEPPVQNPVKKRRYFHHLMRNIDEMRLSWFMAGKGNHFGKNKLVTKLQELMKTVKKD